MSFSLFILILVVLFCGVLFFVATYRPTWVGPALIASLIFGSGLMPLGLTIVDEVWVGSLMMGILFVWMRSKSVEISAATPSGRDVLYEIHRWVFIVFTLYLIFQCARGLIVMDSLRKVRWIVFFVVLGIFSAILDRSKETAPDRSQVAMWVVKSTIVYLVFYLIHGVTAQFLRGTSWWDLQCKEMGTTAYSLFAVALGAPASFIVIREGLRNRWWGEICLVTMFVAGVYYDSRVAVIVLLSFFALGIFYIRWRPLLRLGGVYCLVLLFFSQGFLGKHLNLNALAMDLLASGGADEVVLRAQKKSAQESRVTNAALESIPEVPVAISVPQPVPEMPKVTATISVPTTLPPPAPEKVSAVPLIPPVPETVTSEAIESTEGKRFHFLDPSGKPPHDIDRIIHAEVVFRLLSQGGAHAFFGYGYRMSGRVVSPILRELYSIFIPDRVSKITDDESTEAFTAWVADTGGVGLVLLLALFFLTTLRVFLNARGILGVILVSGVAISFLWMLVINLSDILLLFFAVLPSGIFVGLSRSRVLDRAS
jgi:hypothetical protein